MKVKGKKTFVFCLIAVLLISTTITNMTMSGSKPRLYLEPSSITYATHTDIGPGNQTTVTLQIENVADLWGWSIYLLYEPAVLKVDPLGTSFTTWLKDNAEWNGGTPTVYQKRYYKPPWVPPGVLFMGQMIDPDIATGGASTTGTATLATITFDIIGEGVSALDLDSTELTTIIGTTPIPMNHEVEDGFFDNREANEPPIAKITGPTTGIETYEVEFSASGSTDDGWIVSYGWDFGDGNTEIYVEGVNLTTTVTHAFAVAGTYPVTLTVTDNDGASTAVVHDITIFTWMQAGTFPDLVGWEAKPEMPRLDEGPDARGLDLRSLVGNPTDSNYTVYVEFTLISKDEGIELGTLRTDNSTIGPGEKQELTVYFDTMDPTWRCFSGSPEWVGYGYTHWFFHKYIGYAQAYYKNSTMDEFEEANVAKYLSFKVASFYEHDVAVLNVTASPTDVPQGGTVDEINVTMTNIGELNETVVLTVSYVGAGGVTGIIDERLVTLLVGETITETFSWDTPSTLDLGPYLIVGTLPHLAYETAVGDNSYNTRIYIT
jgi:PKD repeat protein